MKFFPFSDNFTFAGKTAPLNDPKVSAGRCFGYYVAYAVFIRLSVSSRGYHASAALFFSISIILGAFLIGGSIFIAFGSFCLFFINSIFGYSPAVISRC